MSRFGVALAMVTLVACGGRAEPSSASSGVTGRVVAGPICPVETEASPCPPRAVQTDVAVESADGEELRSVRTDADGSFLVALAPGRYLLTPRPPAGNPDLLPRSLTVTVEAGRFIEVTLVLDTRLREPVT
jgi:hypothetical protein